MKTRSRYIVRTLLPLLLLFFGSCKEITTTTQVFRDGSLQRIVEVKPASEVTGEGAFPIPVDESWQVEIVKNEKDSSRSIYRAKKTFANVARLQAKYALPSDTTLQVQVQIDLKKRFRWLYTFYAYEEIYKSYNPFHRVPIRDYITDDELHRFAEDDSTLEEKFEAWGDAAMFEELYCALYDSLQALADAELSPAKLETHKQVLYDALIEKEALESEEWLAILQEVLHSPKVVKLQPQLDAIEKMLLKKIEFAHGVQEDSYTNIVAMPGLLVYSNAEQTEGNVATWLIPPRGFLFEDYIMVAESRVVNLWAVGITVFLALLTLCAWLWAMWRAWRAKRAA
ncbi:hypothetical protein JXO59_14920 [candidate division KSB1 bacterium]|nr:hypothetical protein [candidate division KSB1 bacterium]